MPGDDDSVPMVLKSLLLCRLTNTLTIVINPLHYIVALIQEFPEMENLNIVKPDSKHNIFHL